VIVGGDIVRRGYPMLIACDSINGAVGQFQLARSVVLLDQLEVVMKSPVREAYPEVAGGDIGEAEMDTQSAGEPHGEFWQQFWNTLSCSYTERGGLPRGEVTTTWDFYRDRQWHSTGMYTQCVAPGGEDRELVMPLPAPPGIARQLVFFRRPGPPSATRNGTRPCRFSLTSPRRFACWAAVPPSSR
jgi:hypothetical protein